MIKTFLLAIVLNAVSMAQCVPGGSFTPSPSFTAYAPSNAVHRASDIALCPGSDPTVVYLYFGAGRVADANSLAVVRNGNVQTAHATFWGAADYSVTVTGPTGNQFIFITFTRPLAFYESVRVSINYIIV